MSNEEYLYSKDKKEGSFSVSKGIKSSVWSYNESQKSGEYSVNIGIKTPSWNFTYPEIDLAENRECRDIDGNVYSTVQIGDQLWMAENLKTTKYKDGSEIPTGHNTYDWWHLETDAYAVYDGDSSNADVYGNLYNWYAVDDSKGLAPNGWHIPTDEEIKVLERSEGMSQNESDRDGVYRGTNEGSKLAGRADLWNDGNLENNSEFGISGFNVFPSGKRDYANGLYGTLGIKYRLWSSTEGADIGDNEAAYIRIFTYSLPKISRNHSQKGNAYPVRCVWNGVPGEEQQWKGGTWDWVFNRTAWNLTSSKTWEVWGL